MTALMHTARVDDRLGRRTESLLCLVLVVCVHAAVVMVLSQARAPSESRAPVVVELIVPEPSTAPEQPMMREPILRAPAPSDTGRSKPPAGTPQLSTAPQKTSPAVAPKQPSAPVAPSEPADAASAAANDPPSTASDISVPPVAEGSPAAAPPPPSVAQAPQIKPPSFDAPHLRNPRAEYPRLSRRMGEQGRVVLRVYVSRTGLPQRVELQSSSGSPRLDQAARDSVTQWKFVPARRDNEAVDAWLLVPVVFRLED